MLLRRAALPALRSTIPILHLFNRYGINRSLASIPEAACFDVDGNPKPTSVTGTTRKERKGLYGYDVLETPQGFRAFVQMAIERSEDLISQIKDVPPSMETIRLMDEISDTVCSVVDAAELCRNTHPDREYVDEANQASMKLYSYLHQLNTNSTLYDAVVKAEASNSLTTEEAKRAAKTLRTDFERGGIHLPAEKLDRVTELNMKITGLGRQFAENVINEQGYIDVYPAAKLPNHVHPMLVPIYRSSDGTIRTSLKKGESLDGVQAGMRVSTESGVVSAVLKWVSDPKIRKQVYIAGNTASKSNLHVLDQLIAARHEVAEILGYKTYAEFATAPTMAGSPEVVMSFLHDLIGKTRKKADEEMSMLKEFSRVDTINAWDEVYYSGLFKAHIQDLDAKVVASYFPVEQCLNGLKIIVKSLFGASFEKVPMFPGEAWHPHVQKWALQHPDEGTLGYMFLDLYARKGKFPGCAHFALKGGRRISEADYQLPVIALVCNFSKPNSCAPPMLQHWELENLFHEFGHALHSLLSRTDYQHFSGTRTVLDFAETPSNLFEYYAWDYRVLKTFARHYSSGEVIPEKMVASLNRAKDMLPVTALTRQVLYSVIDQKLFGEKNIAAKDTTQIIAELKHSYTNQKHVEGTHWQTTFNHLVNYGAGYYSYLYAKSIAANIWHKVCVENPLCLSTGNVLRKGFLQHGGARDPTSMIRECLGDQFLISDQLGGVRPCINQLLTELKVHKSSTLFDMMWDNHDFSTELSPKISENDEKVGE